MVAKGRNSRIIDAGISPTSGWRTGDCEILQPVVAEMLPAELRPFFPSNEELVRRARCRDGGAAGTGGWVIMR